MTPTSRLDGIIHHVLVDMSIAPGSAEHEPSDAAEDRDTHLAMCLSVFVIQPSDMAEVIDTHLSYLPWLCHEAPKP